MGQGNSGECLPRIAMLLGSPSPEALRILLGSDALVHPFLLAEVDEAVTLLPVTPESSAGGIDNLRVVGAWGTFVVSELSSWQPRVCFTSPFIQSRLVSPRAHSLVQRSWDWPLDKAKQAFGQAAVTKEGERRRVTMGRVLSVREDRCSQRVALQGPLTSQPLSHRVGWRIRFAKSYAKFVASAPWMWG